uniref:hypothetical protein n=1 Tax=Horticoccus sp. 23ND18S-11 TaxID=3391832 RepID=UPI0039C9B340
VDMCGSSQDSLAVVAVMESDQSYTVSISPMRAIRPNKAPEPTPVAVMPRADSRVIEVKLKSADRNPARVTPATGVAHL